MARIYTSRSSLQASIRRCIHISSTSEMGGGEVLKKGLWTEEEDRILAAHVELHGKGRWNRIAKLTGLKRCGKSCRLRWMNYLCPDINRGAFSDEEDDLIIRLHKLLGNRWSLIAGRVPGRTDNQVKNHWNTRLKKRVISCINYSSTNSSSFGESSSAKMAGSVTNAAALGSSLDNAAASRKSEDETVLRTQEEEAVGNGEGEFESFFWSPWSGDTCVEAEAEPLVHGQLHDQPPPSLMELIMNGIVMSNDDPLDGFGHVSF